MADRDRAEVRDQIRDRAASMAERLGLRTSSDRNPVRKLFMAADIHLMEALSAPSLCSLIKQNNPDWQHSG